MNPDERDAIRAEIAHIDQLLLGALRLGFHEDIRHWKAERQKLVARLRDNR